MTQPDPGTVVLYDDVFADHDPGPHVECPERVLRVHQAFTQGEAPLPLHCPVAAGRKDLERIHAPAHVARIEELCRHGGGALDPDTTACPDTYRAALFAAGAGLEGIRLVEASPGTHPFCLVRPPGHHALRDRAMGFCFFNNIAVTAAALVDRGVERILIVDFDVHHGNGTQDAFYHSAAVHFVSHHRSPFYPGSGAMVETGAGEGLGATTNLPTRLTTPARDQVARLEDTLHAVARAFRPQWVLVSAGFDAYAGDPLGGLGWEAEHFHAVGRCLGTLAREGAGRRLVSFLEGGYDVYALPDLIRAYLDGALVGLAM